MNVTFTKTHARGYRVSVEGPGIVPSYMDPAPGYDDRLPHDAAHFLVENELGIIGAVFGRLAMGATFGNLTEKDDRRAHRKARRRSSVIAKATEDDARFSEHVIWSAQARWEKHEIVPATEVAREKIDRLIDLFEGFAMRWQALPIGGSITLQWSPPSKYTRSRRKS